MNKLLLSLFIFLLSIPAFSQFVENFENTEGPTGPLPAIWPLSSGNWAVFENNTPSSLTSAQNWGINSFTLGIFHSPQQCASVGRENLGDGSTSEDFLVTPAIHVPETGIALLHFYTRMFTSGNQGTSFKIMWTAASNLQTDPNSYIALTEWTESNLIVPTTDFNLWTEKTIELPATLASQDIFIAFVRVHTQTTPGLEGDRWLIDDVSIDAQTNCFVSASATTISPTSIRLTTFTNDLNPVEAMVLPCDDPAPSSSDNGVVILGNTYLFENLLPNACYKVYVKNNCSGAAVWLNVNLDYNYAPIHLAAFVDSNNNGIMDSGETQFTYGQFTITNNAIGGIITSLYTSSYAFIPNQTSTTFDFGYQILGDYNSCYTLGVLNYDDIQPSLTTQTFYFPVVPIDCFDLRVSLSPGTLPRSGTNDTDYLIIIANGTNPPSTGTLTYTKAPEVTIVSVTPSAGITLTTTGFTYNYTGLAEGYPIPLQIVTSVPITVNIGDLLSSIASLSFSPSDTHSSNNSHTLTQRVIASYDPNDINESHGPKIQFDQFGSNDYLYYTIRFQNTGNANAIKVRVDDVLDSKIDETSISMVAARHGYRMVRNGNAISWEFNNIQLPPASVNEDLSNGFITYRVKLKPGFAIGDVIPNTASIYFDSNPAIVTNTFDTEFVQLLGNAAFDNNSISLHPNPASNLVTITNTATEKLSKITIYDISGKRIYSLTDAILDTLTIDVSAFSKGLYLVELASDNDLKIIKKLILH